VAENLDSGEVAMVPVVDENSDEPGLEAASEEDGDDDELSAPGNSAAGLVAAPPSDES